MSSPTPAPVLIADDDPTTRKLLQYFCDQAGIKTEAYKTGDELLEAIGDETCVAIVDLRMPGTDGLECLRTIKKRWERIEVIILTAINEAREAVAALREGAFEYFTKPFEAEELIPVVQNALRLSRTSAEKDELRHSVGFSGEIRGMVAESEAGRRVMEEAQRIAPINATVLVHGESGTGKSALARAIHQMSPRAEGPFIEVNCPSMPRELLESEMFGHEKGAFTGAYQRRIGRSELADKGTLFLDEIGDLPLDLQPKLLRFLQDKVFQRVGSTKDIKSDVRLVAATNRDLKELVGAGQFREDLYFRLSVLPILIPPLRDRSDDLPALIKHILGRIRADRKCAHFEIDAPAREALLRYDWPGNIRELQNVLERGSALCQDSRIRLNDLPPNLQDVSASSAGRAQHLSVAGVPLKDLERQAIEQTLDMCDGNKAKAARILGVTEKSIYNKMKRLEIER